MKIPWERFGARLGVGFCLLGIIFVFLGWNGAASVDRVQSQFPYLISGGVMGLCLVVIGAALIVTQSSREDRARLRAEIEELRAVVERAGLGGSSNGRGSASEHVPAGSFVAGDRSYHLATCRLLEGRDGLEVVTSDQVSNRGLAACRVCKPDASRPSRSRARSR